jgi:hypothetical protein
VFKFVETRESFWYVVLRVHDGFERRLPFVWLVLTSENLRQTLLGLRAGISVGTLKCGRVNAQGALKCESDHVTRLKD